MSALLCSAIASRSRRTTAWHRSTRADLPVFRLHSLSGHRSEHDRSVQHHCRVGKVKWREILTSGRHDRIVRWREPVQPACSRWDVCGNERPRKPALTPADEPVPAQLHPLPRQDRIPAILGAYEAGLFVQPRSELTLGQAQRLFVFGSSGFELMFAVE